MFDICNLNDLRDALNRLRTDDRTVICTLASPPGSDLWYATVTTVDGLRPLAATRSGLGKSERVDEAITNAIEDFIAGGKHA